MTCGGLCPGLNDVIRGLVRNLTNHYGVPRSVGFRNGYQGFIASYRHDVVDLTPQSIRDSNVDGGTVLGTSLRTAGSAGDRRPAARLPPGQRRRRVTPGEPGG